MRVKQILNLILVAQYQPNFTLEGLNIVSVDEASNSNIVYVCYDRKGTHLVVFLLYLVLLKKSGETSCMGSMPKKHSSRI